MTGIVVLPGLDGTGRLLDAFCARLGALGVPARAVAYPADVPLGYAALEPIARAALPTDRPFVLAAESFSGPIAIRLAADAPPGLVGLVLSATFARSAVPSLRPLAPLLRFAPTRAPIGLVSFMLMGRWSTPALRAEIGDLLRIVAPDVWRIRAAAALRVDVRDALGRILVPALCLRATHDRLVGPRAHAELMAGLAHAEAAEFDGPHMLLQTVDATATAIAAFARRCGERVAASTSPPAR